MLKSEAIALLGGSVKRAAQAMDLVPQTIYIWPDELTQLQVDRVQAALWRKQERERREARLAELEAAQNQGGRAA